jgi:hypothetical protein
MFISLAGLSPSLAAAETPSNPAQIVQKVLQAYGGHAALERIQGVRHSGTIQSFRLSKTGTFARLFVMPDRLRVDLSYPDGPKEQRITTPDGAWRDGRPATGPMHSAMKLQAARFRLPLLLAERPTSLLGAAQGRLRLGMKLTDSTSLEVLIDSQTWRIVRSVGQMTFNGMNMAFTADYSDFRLVDGVLFAHREELTAMGMPTGIVTLERIEINPAIRPEDFTP